MLLLVGAGVSMRVGYPSFERYAQLLVERFGVDVSHVPEDDPSAITGAVLLRNNVVMLLRLQDGRTRTLTPGRSPVLAELEPAGLYYSYGIAGGRGRVVSMPRSEAEPAKRAG